MKLEAEFEVEMRNMLARAFNEFGTIHHRFAELLDRYGGVGAAKHLMGREFFDFENFYRHRPEFWVEAWMIQPRFRPLFTPEELEIAEARIETLHTAGY